MIVSINTSETQILRDIKKLHLKNEQIEIDTTYNIGAMYKDVEELKPKIKTDKTYYPEINIIMNIKNIPLRNESISSVMYDPPFLCRTGQAKNRDKTAERFGYYTSREEQLNEYQKAIGEIQRVLKPCGIVIIKIGDMKGNKYYSSHVDIINMLTEKKLAVIDIFIKIRVRDQNKKNENQRVAKQMHTFFIIAKKKRRYTKQ